jgi:hypothetical protein
MNFALVSKRKALIMSSNPEFARHCAARKEALHSLQLKEAEFYQTNPRNESNFHHWQKLANDLFQEWEQRELELLERL